MRASLVARAKEQAWTPLLSFPRPTKRKKADARLRWHRSGKFASSADKRLLKERIVVAVGEKHALGVIWRLSALCDMRLLSASP
jgi:hypothetical protein